MHPRLAEEWDDIKTVYADAIHLASPERVELTVALLDSLYNLTATRVAVLVPAGYRVAGPDGFCIPAGLALTSGQALPVSDATAAGLPNWQIVSFHMID